MVILMIGGIGVTKGYAQGSAPTGAINGAFSISAGQQVYFSKGNLQYQASTNTWRFAEHQWDFVGGTYGGVQYGNVSGSSNNNISSTYSGWIDLFGWGTSGWNSGAQCYQPWSTSNDWSDYCPGNSVFTNLVGDYANADWGVYNAISNGGNQAGQWRTLTNDEWRYVFKERITLSGIRWARAIVNGVKGLIMLPDNWMPSMYNLNNPNDFYTSYDENIIDATTWNNYLEANGAVFFAACGMRTRSNYNWIADCGWYYSTTGLGGGDAWVFEVNGYTNAGYLGTGRSDDRSDGKAVRLVRPISSFSCSVNVTSDPSNGGSVTGGGTYTNGSICTVTATPNSGYYFLNWTSNGIVVSNSSTFSFNVGSNTTIVAHFMHNPIITVIANPSDGGTVTGGGVYEYGQRCWLKAVCANGYAFVNWTKDGVVVGPNQEYGFFAKSDATYVANFTNNYTISASVNPTNGGMVSGTGNYTYGSNCTLTATPSAGWRFLNWTENDIVVSVNASYTFTVTGGRVFVANFTQNGGGGDHAYVDLGLPSGRLWATCNLGANAPEEYGDYYAWIEDDVATANWGDDWRMPTKEDFQELRNNTTLTWMTQNGVNGMLFTANNGNSIFLPAAGYRNNGSLSYAGSDGIYWSSSLYNTDYPGYAWLLYFDDSSCFMSHNVSYYGQSVRPVRSGQNVANVTATCSPAEGGTVTGGGSYQQGQTCTLTATANTGYTFTNWTENGNVVSTNATYTFTVTGNRTLVANFEEEAPTQYIKFDLYDSYGDGWNGNKLEVNYGNRTTEQLTISSGSSATHNLQIPNGSHVTLTWIMGSKTEECSFKVSYPNGNNIYLGSNLSADFTYSFDVDYDAMPTTTYNISVSANPSNGGTVSGAGSYNCGSSCTVNATANTGYTFASWTENGNVVSTSASYSFTVSGNRTLVANFTANPVYYTVNVSVNPSGGGNVSGGGSYQQGQTCTLTATANTGYTFTNWTENGNVVSTNATYTFTVIGDRTLGAYFTLNGGSGDHAYVDLGLPSGTLWATCNVGAENSEDYGDYFAWGETQPKDTYNWSTYQYCMGSSNTLTKYCSNSSNGYNEYTDNLTTLLPEDDAATVNWGNGWRMPTKEEFEELYNNTTVTWTTQNGVNGRLFTASNGSSLFLPAAGYRSSSSLCSAGSYGYYRSSSLNTDNPGSAWYFGFLSGSYDMYSYYRYLGQSVRPVRLGQNIAFVIATCSPAEGGAVSGGGTYEEGAECTLTATPSDGYTFANWTENGEIVSTEATYTFTVTGDRTLVANFTYNGGSGNTPTGAINGHFSVSADQQVYFSQGNLQYQASTNTWKFAENQWDMIGSENSNISENYAGWIDLFGWGTSGYNHGANCYQPWSTSTSSNDYQAYGYSNYNLYDQTGQADWGYNPISNGGNQTNQWRTLTKAEWQYVFNTRTTASGIRYAKANVNNINGVILLPDDWSSSTYSLSNTNSSGASFSSNTISASQWSALEQAGAVFLPAAGYRDGTSVYVVGSYGNYWSASYYGSSGAYYVDFDDSGLYASDGSYRYYGQSVRLVCPAENYSFSINAVASPAEGGEVSGGGAYPEGAECTLTATPSDGWSFVNWTENGEIVSTEATYTFIVTGNRNLVGNFTESITTQTIALSSGVNWVSFNVNITLADLKAALVEALPNDNATVTIKSKQKSTRYQNGRWSGSFGELDMAHMYMIIVSDAFDITLEGTRVDLTELIVTISNGANWIAYPLDESMTITDIFGSFSVNNDQIKSKKQSARYNNGRWTGSLRTLNPGQGYIYISEDPSNRVFTFPINPNKGKKRPIFLQSHR